MKVIGAIKAIRDDGSGWLCIEFGFEGGPNRIRVGHFDVPATVVNRRAYSIGREVALSVSTVRAARARRAS